MGDVEGRRDINNALVRIRSEKGDERLTGLIDLKSIIQENRHRSKLNNIKDGGYHTILETIFRVVKLESAHLVRASKTIKTKIESRLSACASLVRLVVDIALQKLRYKTVKAIVKHVTQSLPTADASYCEPLLKDYLKALVTLLEHKSHPEHFLGTEWHELVDFCIDLVCDLNRTYEPHDSSIPNGIRTLRASSIRGNIYSRESTPSVFGDNGRSSGKTTLQGALHPHLRECDREVVSCLRSLASVPNAPIMDRADVLLKTLIDLLQSYSKTSTIQQSGFESINSIISRVIINDISLAVQTSEKLLPFLRRFWQSKDAILKETLLAFLTYVEILLPRMLSMDATKNCKDELNAIIEVLREDYCSRRLRERLQLEDISLPDPTSRLGQQIPLSTKVHQVRMGSMKAEHPWCLISSSAAIMVALENDTKEHEIALGIDDMHVAAKRQRLTHPVDDLLRLAKGSLLPEKQYALQALVFIYDSLNLDDNTLQGHLDVLLPYLSDDDGLLVSWAMLALTSAAGQQVARKPNFEDSWLQIWRLVARHVTSTITCRAACHLLATLLDSGLVQYTGVADLVDSMTRSIDLNGPAVCDESATTFWAILLVLRGRAHLGSIHEMCEIVLGWLLRRWSPSKLSDRNHASYIAQHLSIFSTLRLVCLFLGLDTPADETRIAINLGRLSQARMEVKRDSDLMRYLLLFKNGMQPAVKSPSVTSFEASSINIPLAKSQILASTLTEFLQVEASALLRTSFPSSIEHKVNLNTESLHVIVSFCTIGYAVLSSSKCLVRSLKDQLETSLNGIREGIKHLLLQSNGQRDLMKGLYNVFGSFNLSLDRMTGGMDLFSNCAIAMSQGFDKQFWLKVSPFENLLETEDSQDPLNDVDEFDSQGSSGRNEAADTDESHFEIPAATNAMAFQACVSAKICLLSALSASNGAVTTKAVATASIVDYLTGLSASNFIAGRSFICELLDSTMPINESDASALLEYLGEALIPQYEYERSEVSLGVTLDIMSGLAETWTRRDSSDIAEIGATLYKWFTEIALKKGISSPHVLICISSMLQKIIKIQPEYARHLSLQSARTSLFEVLREGSITVKFNIGNEIAEIFGLFVLKEHENILGDVITNLPNNPTWIEGIALRLLVLANLAASWSTLLRRCVYAILECPRHVPESARHAQHCLDLITKSLHLANSEDLFKLFVSQILYTWLETQPLRSIPYAVFGYSTLPDLYCDVQDEIVGHIVMRGKDVEATQLAEDLELPFEQLLRLSFGKASAYCIARDVALSGSKDITKSEAGIRQIIGKDMYRPLLVANFASILAFFFKIMDPDGQIEKTLKNHDLAGDSYLIYTKILGTTGSGKQLPLNQQPSFKAKYLLQQINHLCVRAGYNAASLWSPALYVYVFRELLNGIHPALGSLHACAVLRRIRILICMAGDIALQEYPLEMALHSLKLYLTEPQCADEAIGMVQYLIGHGASYLEKAPSFLAGHAVSSLTSMKSFFDSTQDSTTQESQFKATMSRAQAFHGWFSDFLGSYDSPNFSQESRMCFEKIIKAARNIQTGGNAKVGTYESDLLLELLEDQYSGTYLLDQSSRDTILKFLCSPFEVPKNFREDILGSDKEAARFASTVWLTCQREVCSREFTLWAGRVLGRAYAGSGLLDEMIVSETQANPTNNLLQSQISAPLADSRSNILRLLSAMLLSDQSIEVGIAETALRSIITRTLGKDHGVICEQSLPSSLTVALLWKNPSLPPSRNPWLDERSLKEVAAFNKDIPALRWIQQLCMKLASTATEDPFLTELAGVIRYTDRLAEMAYPYILHLVLLREVEGRQSTREIVSEAYKQWFQGCEAKEKSILSSTRVLLEALLYLKAQPLPHETVQSDRFYWLDIDYKQAAAAAINCSMFKTALLFLEIGYSEIAKIAEASKSSRRSSTAIRPDLSEYKEPADMLLEIYRNIDEQDAFYGVQQPSSLTSMMARLEYEHAGFKSLSFRGAHYDAQLRKSDGRHEADEESMVRALNKLDLHGLSRSLLGSMNNPLPSAMDSMLQTARKLEQWDISAPVSYVSSAGTIFKTFQVINIATTPEDVLIGLNTGFAEVMDQIVASKTAKSSIHALLGCLATLVEIDEVFSSRQPGQLYEVLERLKTRDQWMYSENYDHIKNIISCRESIFSLLSKRSKLQDMLRTSPRDARALESHLLLASSTMSRFHGALQNALTTATYLNQLVKPCEEAGVDISAAVQLESANVLWGQGEMTASIRMLQDLKNSAASDSQFVRVGKPELLAKLGHQISEARLEKPDEIIRHYLAPAIAELHNQKYGDEAGEVFHEFASFCDQQLQNPDGLEDFRRIQKLRDSKEAEVKDMNKMMESKGSQTKERNIIKSHRDKAQQWFDLDNREFQRLHDSRQTFLRQSLENYLLCLRACDKYDSDALRFSALWLENHESKIANAAVAKHISQVGSRKFATLMNQWSSRLLHDEDDFQKLLSSLVFRICIDHPYHGMYQIFAGSKSKGSKDKTALSRNAAANMIVSQLKASRHASGTWTAVHNTNISFVRFASEKLDDASRKQNMPLSLRGSPYGQRVEQDVLIQKVPPPTARIELRADCDYSDVPVIDRFHPEFTVAGGISAPKIVIAFGTDGKKYKQLFKSGNDDLRQDSIMEQVFEQVSNLLRTQRATRQRKLGIRTYKVLPLTSREGVIEFVSDTIPLHDYLLPAHSRHFPKDLKVNAARKYIADAQSKSADYRLEQFKKVCDRFRPVMRYFFTEHFESPDDWFEKRLAYTRSTAAISILGHVLGLGDRHGHNILLDEKTGEVVHIDLGIAFEQGRVLAVPEIVPFRLTRDLVDAMGITKTEGVFRRCCEFTLEALRNESYSIMTILDVLRYDPLYTWSLSPLRLKRMQDAQAEGPLVDEGAAGGNGVATKNESEEGEAERALTVVKKKLSRSLSVQATVNELIQMATDERNLAVLFAGWAAYA